MKLIDKKLKNAQDKIIKSDDSVIKVIQKAREKGLKIVLTMGTFDLVHIGHARYLKEAKNNGSFLIVGVDSDAKVKSRKGPTRPVVPHVERMEMLSHMTYVDAVFLKYKARPKWFYIKKIRPDVLIATKQTYSPKQVAKVEKLCGKIRVLKPQATTSTSAKIRLLQIGIANKFQEKLVPKLLSAIDETLEEVKK